MLGDAVSLHIGLSELENVPEVRVDKSYAGETVKNAVAIVKLYVSGAQISKLSS